MIAGSAEDGGAGGKTTEGTGLGEGDTRGAKDIGDELTDQDQLLGSRQKDQPQQEQEAPSDDPQPQQEEDKGLEMDDDFEGGLEDVQLDPNAQSGVALRARARARTCMHWPGCRRRCSAKFNARLPPPCPSRRADGEDEGEQDESRVDQQMGEAGPDAEAVDERLWNDEEDEQQPQQPGRVRERHGSAACSLPAAGLSGFNVPALPALAPRAQEPGKDERAVQVQDKAQLDYAQGGPEDEADDDQTQQEPESADQQQRQEQQHQHQQGDEDEDMGEYEDRCVWGGGRGSAHATTQDMQSCSCTTFAPGPASSSFAGPRTNKMAVSPTPRRPSLSLSSQKT